MIELADIISPLIAAACAFAGSWYAFSTRLAKVETKLDIIEKKQDKHNDVIERTYKAEERLAYIDHTLDDIKEDIARYHK